MTLSCMVAEFPSITDLMSELLVLEAREQNLRDRLDVLELYPRIRRIYVRVQHLIVGIHQERRALEQMMTVLFGAKPGRC